MYSELRYYYNTTTNNYRKKMDSDSEMRVGPMIPLAALVAEKENVSESGTQAVSKYDWFYLDTPISANLFRWLSRKKLARARAATSGSICPPPN